MSNPGDIDPGDAGGASSETTTPESNRRRGWIVAVTVVVAVIIAVALAVALWPKGDGPVVADETSAPASDPSSPAPTADSSSGPSAEPSPEATDEPVAPTADPGNPFPELPPVAPEETVSTQGVEVQLTKFESVQGEVVGPGEVAGAAVRVTVAITNSSDEPLDLGLVVVNAYMGAERDPAETYEQPGGSPVSGTLDPGAAAEGVYLFRIPEDRRDDVTFVVDYRPGSESVVFQGPVPEN